METVTELVVDLSGSMQDKIAITKQILLSDVIPGLDYTSKIGIKSFSAVKGQQPIKQELPLSIVDRDLIVKAVNGLTVKNGNTPISEAIRQSVTTLKEYSASFKKIILVTDGEEDKGGDYIAECKKARTEGIECEIHVIGIGLNSQAQAKAQEISTLTNGTYSYIPFTKGAAYNQSAVRESLAPFYSVSSRPPIVEPAFIPTNLSHRQFPEQQTASLVETIPTTRKDNEENPEQVSLLNDTTNVGIGELLKTLVDEIKEIKSEIKNLKGQKEELPEIIEDAELNEKIRVASENYLFKILKTKYPNRVKWLNENSESNADHDFEILEEDGSVEYYIECKGTPKQKPTFYLTKNEWRLFLNNTRDYQVYFVQNVFSAPSQIFISNVLDWLLKGKLLPYLKSREVIKEERVFLTISDSQFVKWRHSPPLHKNILDYIVTARFLCPSINNFSKALMPRVLYISSPLEIFRVMNDFFFIIKCQEQKFCSRIQVFIVLYVVYKVQAQHIQLGCILYLE